jgi:hypothetical protein
VNINPDHVEFAVVERLKLLLETSGQSAFNVTSTYSFFVPIVCWTVQRMRALPKDEATEVLEKLNQEALDSSPWLIPTSIPSMTSFHEALPLRVGPFSDFADRSVGQFLIDIRNAVAHGDARCVRPFPEPKPGTTDLHLLGFKFDCSEIEGSGKHQKLAWSGSITLLETDMRRIGSELAERFCKALRRKSENRANFPEEARNHVREEKKAA